MSIKSIKQDYNGIFIKRCILEQQKMEENKSITGTCQGSEKRHYLKTNMANAFALDS